MEGFIIIGVLLAVYFFPSFVAQDRKHPSTGGIVVLNIFLGWTLLGWVVALVWAASGERGDAKEGAPANAMRQCPSCFGEIDARASVCRFCRTSLSDDEEDEDKDEVPRVYEIK